MSKPSRYASQLLAKKETETKRKQAFAIQQATDIAIIALNEAFGFGAERIRTFMEVYHDVWREYAAMTLDDAESDKQLNYTKAKVDAKLKAICGDYFQPWEERYGEK